MPRFALNGATTGETVDVETDIRVAAEAGYEAVELRDGKIERYLAGDGRIESLRERLTRSNISALSINALEDATLGVRTSLDETLTRCARLCLWARALGAPYIVAVPSALPPAGLAEREARARTVDALKAIARVAGDAGVKVGFEFLGFPTCSVRTLHAARTIVDEVGDPNVGLVIDAFHFHVGGSRFEDLESLDASSVFIIHLDDAEPGEPASLIDAQRVFPGEGVIPLTALVRRVEDTGFDGFSSLELFRPAYWTWDPGELARCGLERMRSLFLDEGH